MTFPLKTFVRQARILRDQNRFAEAQEILDEANERAAKADPKPPVSDLSWCAYERAFLQTIQGHYDAAIEGHTYQAEVARGGGDELRALTANMHLTLNQYYSMKISGLSAIEKLRDLRTKIFQFDPGQHEDASFVHDCHYNITAHMMEVLYDVGDAEWRPMLEKVFSMHSFNHAPGRIPGHDSYRLSHEARAQMDEGHFEHAAVTFSKILGLTEFPGYSTKDGSPYKYDEIQEYAANTNHRPARNFRDFSRAVLGTDLSDKESWAKRILKQGLGLDSGKGNLVYLHDMEADLRQLEQA